MTSPQPDSARVIIDVVAGIIPERPEEEFSHRWTMSSSVWDAAPAEKRWELQATLAGQAQGYAGALMQQPDRVNWVRLDWVWL